MELLHTLPLITKIVLFANMGTEHRHAMQTQIMNVFQKQHHLKVRIQNFSFHGLEPTVMKTICFLTQKDCQDFLSIQWEAFIRVQKV